MRHIYLDLDGVFADFYTDVAPLNYLEDPVRAWRHIDQIDNFFLTLDLLPGSKELFDALYKREDLAVRILTALPKQTNKLVTAASDKRAWVARYLSPVIPVICCQDGWKGKSFFAEPGAVLIDDSLRNINDWAAHGGTGIHHTSVYNTLKELEYQGV